jgi:hypothetical protein
MIVTVGLFTILLWNFLNLLGMLRNFVLSGDESEYEEPPLRDVLTL